GRADVAEDVQRLLRAGVTPAVALAPRPRRSDGDERQVDAGEPRADLAEHARVVTRVSGEIHAPARALDDVPGGGVVPERVDAVAATLVARRHGSDREARDLDRLPRLQRPLAGLQDLVRVGLAALREEHGGVAPELA